MFLFGQFHFLQDDYKEWKRFEYLTTHDLDSSGEKYFSFLFITVRAIQVMHICQLYIIKLY